jgi:hypothetical protein
MEHDGQTTTYEIGLAIQPGVMNGETRTLQGGVMGYNPE